MIEPSSLPAIKTSTVSIPKSSSLDQDDFQRKMDDLNRQIEAQKMAIAGILTKTDLVNTNVFMIILHNFNLHTYMHIL